MIMRSAEFSKCRTWRYSLTRRWNSQKPRAVFVGLNPSTADEKEDDATIRRCVGFAHAWGYGGVVMVNLFAFRSRDPRGLLLAPDPVGPDNDAWIETEASDSGIIIAAWGTNGAVMYRAARVLEILSETGKQIFCLGKTKGGSPRYPLYLPQTAKPEIFR